MDSNNIKELLDKYWSCETTLAEEQQLRDYFQQAEVSEEWKETAAVFRYFEENNKKAISDVSFDGEVLRKAQTPIRTSKATRLLYNSMRIAAGLVVVIVATWFIKTEVRKSTPQEVVDTYDDPKLAFEETKKALMMISKSFGTAQEQAKKLDLFNEAQEEIQKKKDPKL